ncbi:MAG: type VI secretion system tip protein TssI/VgrG [Pseudomonadota bacterium]
MNHWIKGRAAAAALALTVSVAAAMPVGTAFLYQGELAQTGALGNASYDFSFHIFDAASGGQELAPEFFADDVAVINGRFGVELDFGSLPFDGGGVWLELRVREGTSSGSYTALAPRQALLPTPYALHAGSVELDAVGGANIVDGSLAEQDLSDQAVTSRKLADGAVSLGKIDGSRAPADVALGVLGIRNGQVTWLEPDTLRAAERAERMTALLDAAPAVSPLSLDAVSCRDPASVELVLTVDGEDYRDVRAFSARERVAASSVIDVVVAAASPLTLVDALDQVATLLVTLNGRSTRFTGPIVELALLENSARDLIYRFSIGAPWDRLHRDRDYGLYQELSSNEILENVLVELGPDFDLQGSYDPLTIVTRYDETAWTFARRLMEREGLFLIVDHLANGNGLRVGDHNALFGNSVSTLSVVARGSRLGQTPALAFTQLTQRAVAAAVSTQGFGDNTPPQGLFASSGGSGERGDYLFEPSLKSQSRVNERNAVRAAQLAVAAARFRGVSNDPALRAGTRFTVERPAELAGDYLAVAVRHGLLNDGTDRCAAYVNEIEAIPESISFRLPTVTPAPVAPAMSTATVVGPAGETFFSLPGEASPAIKIQFHWDGEGALDETAGPFVRLATATDNIFRDAAIPPIGSEVLVSFIEGNVDEPVIVGALHNPGFPRRPGALDLGSPKVVLSVFCFASRSLIVQEQRADDGEASIGTGGSAPNGCQISPDTEFDQFSVSLATASPALSAGCEVDGGNLICGAVNFSGNSVPSDLTVVLY